MYLREFDSHPYIAIIKIDPADYERFERIIDEAPELRMAGREIDRPDVWTLHIACASRRVQERVEDAWG